MAQLCAPPLLGLLAATAGARHALLVITGAMVLSLAVAGTVRPIAGEVTGGKAVGSSVDDDVDAGVDDAGVPPEPALVRA